MDKQRQHNDAWHWVRVKHILPVTASESRDGRCRCDGVAVEGLGLQRMPMEVFHTLFLESGTRRYYRSSIFISLTRYRRKSIGIKAKSSRGGKSG